MAVTRPRASCNRDPAQGAIGQGKGAVLTRRVSAQGRGAGWGIYPYILTTGRMLFHWHTETMTRRLEALTDQLDEAFVEISPEDAKEIGVKNEDLVHVRSRRGEISLKTWILEKIRRGIVFIPFYFAEATANVLKNPALDSQTKIT